MFIITEIARRLLYGLLSIFTILALNFMRFAYL